MRHKTRKQPRLTDTAFAVSLFTEEEFAMLKELADDRDGLDDTFDAYVINRTRLVERLRENGAHVVDIPLTCAEIFAYCQQSGSPNNGATRARLASELSAKHSAD